MSSSRRNIRNSLDQHQATEHNQPDRQNHDQNETGVALAERQATVTPVVVCGVDFADGTFVKIVHVTPKEKNHTEP